MPHKAHEPQDAAVCQRAAGAGMRRKRAVSALLAGAAFCALSAAASGASADEGFVLPGFTLTDESVPDVERVSRPPALPQDDFSTFSYTSTQPNVSFTFPGVGFSGLLTLDHIEQEPIFSNVKPMAGMIGDATINWRFSESFSLSTSVGRRLAETEELSLLGVFEDMVGGGITYYVTPRFQVTAEGLIAAPSLTDQSLDQLPGEASFIATYQFLPFFSGSVNYTYELRDSVIPTAPNTESTVSFRLIGKF